MAKRFKPLEMKLKALDYHSFANINITSQVDLKALVIWLEDQKIRHYKMDDRHELRNNTGDNWLATFQKYCKDLSCPFDQEVEHTEVVDWLVTVALKCEYSDEADHTPSLRAGLSRPAPTESSTMQAPKSSLDIDPSDEISQKGIKALARVLQIGDHPDLTVLLAACRMVIQDKLTESAMTEYKEGGKPKGYFSLTPQECGFNFKDPVLAEAAKVLRLLHIEELRKLQTSINELIVEVQRLTANPKTDQSLGKVGR